MPLKTKPNQFPYSIHCSSQLNICDSVNQKALQAKEKSRLILWFSDRRDQELVVTESTKGS